jgi:hypothetical protein
MTGIWLFAGRDAVVASYVTLAVADPAMAAELAAPYGAAVLIVAVADLRAARRTREP